MKMEEFIAWIRHISWCGYQIAAKQNFNVKPTDEQWESLIKGVEFALDNPGVTPEQCHNNWLQSRLEGGWKLGTEINPIAKTHPNMIPYGQLPEVERRKDLMGVMAQNMGMKFWGMVQPDVQITKEDIFDAVGRAAMMNASSKKMVTSLETALPAEAPMRSVNLGPEKRKRVAPMPPVEPGATAPGPGCKPLDIKPLPGQVPGASRVKEVSLGFKTHKYRCAVYLQHRYSNEPEFDQVLITVVTLSSRWSRPSKPAVVLNVHAHDPAHARNLALDLFRSVMSMKQIGETGGGFNKRPEGYHARKHNPAAGSEEDVK